LLFWEKLLDRGGNSMFVVTFGDVDDVRIVMVG